jgi:hypothetical protein
MTHTMYRIHDSTEESGCPQCGHPLFAGDTAWEVDSGILHASGFCSRRCMLSAEADRRDTLNAQPA